MRCIILCFLSNLNSKIFINILFSQNNMLSNQFY